MQKNYNAVNGQSIFDVCLKTYGTLDLLFKLLQDSNGTDQGVDDVPASSQLYVYDDALVSNQLVSQSYNLSGINYATYFGTNGSSMYVINQNPVNTIPDNIPPDTTPIPNPSNMQTLVESASIVSGADGTTVLVLPDKNGDSLIGYDVIWVEREIKPIRRANWVWNKTTATITFINGESLDNQQELFYIYTKTITA